MSTSLNSDKLPLTRSEAHTPAMRPQAGEALAQDGSTEPGAAKPVAGGMLHPFTVRNFTLLFSGQSVSIIGDALYAVALPWLILTTGGSAQELGLVLAAYGIPRAGSMLVGGWLSDRLRPRRLMLIADTVRMLLVGILAALALWGHPALWQLCAVAVPLGAFGGAFLPASMSVSGLPILHAQRPPQAGHGGGQEGAAKGSQRHGNRAELPKRGMSPQGQRRQDTNQQHTHGISDQHESPRAQAITQPATHQHAPHARNAIGCQDKAQRLGAASSRQDQPWKRHRIERIADDRNGLPAKEQREVPHREGVQHPSRNRPGRSWFR